MFSKGYQGMICNDMYIKYYILLLYIFYLMQRIYMQEIKKSSFLD